jgi:hypothetical protein
MGVIPLLRSLVSGRTLTLFSWYSLSEYSACKIMRVSASSCVLAKQLQSNIPFWFNILTVSGLDFVKNQISCFQFTPVVVDIFDRYDIQNSIKNAERDRRSKSVFTAFDWKYLYYRNVLFQLMYKICLTGFAHCAIVVKQLCWNRTNWKRQNLFNSNVLLVTKDCLKYCL